NNDNLNQELLDDCNMDTNNTDKMSTDEIISPRSMNLPISQKNFQILLVNDNTDIRDYLADLSNEFDVLRACSCQEAIQILKNLDKLPDLILIDVMPNGCDLLDILKSDTKTQSIPVILLSTEDIEKSSIDESNKKANDYLIKPFTVQELISRIHVNIEHSQLLREILLQRNKNDEINQLLLSISNNILSGVNLKAILSNVIKEIQHILPCKRISIISFEPTHLIVSLCEDSSKVTTIIEPMIEICNKDESLTTINSSKFMNNNIGVEILTDVYCKDSHKNVSILSIEIRTNDNCCGWIKIYRLPNSIWLNSEIELLQQISNQLSFAIIHNKLLEEGLEQDLQIKVAEDANQVKSQILATTSHELRTPLGAIVGILSSLENTGLNDNDQRDMINIMARASDDVLSIINTILDAAKIEAQKITLVNSQFHLLNLLSDTIETFGEDAGNKQIELIMNCDVDTFPSYVISDPKRLKQVLKHLLQNSVKFTKKGEIIMNTLIQSREVIDENPESPSYGQTIKKDCLLIELHDTGIGIDPEFIEHVFESFSKADTSITRTEDGTGLGLSICKNLVEINGGEIKAESQLGIGSKFWLTWNIELLENLSTSYLGTLFNDEISHFLPLSIRSKRILIIHPNESVRNAITKYFKGTERVDAFETFDQGIQKVKDNTELYKQFSYDIIFIGLYEKNEEEVVKTVSELRKIEFSSNNSLNSLVIFIVFPSIKGKELAERLIKNVEGQINILYTPLTWKKMVSQFSCAENDFNKQICSKSNIINDLNVSGSDTRNIPVSNKKCILYVDNKINLKITSQKISELGYSVISVTSVKDAINIIKTEFGIINNICSKTSRISMILIDYNLSKLSDSNISQVIRAMSSPVSNIPIVAITDLITEEIRNKCIDSDINDCILKSSSTEQFEKILIQWISKD
ncbi:11526_t:CDS:10, partial [Scutellospora calospora]